MSLGFLSEVNQLFSMIGSIVILGSVIPFITAGVRRLHDTDKSGWWLLIGMLPFINLLLVYFLAISGMPGDNRFGPKPTN